MLLLVEPSDRLRYHRSKTYGMIGCFNQYTLISLISKKMSLLNSLITAAYALSYVNISDLVIF
jgi:hypothetical protein